MPYSVIYIPTQSVYRNRRSGHLVKTTAKYQGEVSEYFVINAVRVDAAGNRISNRTVRMTVAAFLARYEVVPDGHPERT